MTKDQEIRAAKLKAFVQKTDALIETLKNEYQQDGKVSVESKAKLKKFGDKGELD